VAELALKLATTPNHLPALKRALEDRGAGSASPASLLASTYYDSADLKLRRQHLCFCVQEQDERRVQALKGNGAANDDGALHGEWSDPIAGDRPDPAAPETGPRLRAVIVGDELRPLFKTQVRRTLFKLDTDPAVEIAAALDEGEIQSAESSSAELVCELGLELKRGEPAALYDMALRLLDVAPLRIEPLSESERGYRLSGDGVRSVGARPLALDRSMSVEAVLQSVGRECLRHLLRNEPAALAGEGEAFHQMRVALRRLRSAMCAVKSMLPPAQYRWVQDELKRLADCLGPARNWDVFTADLLAPVQSALPQDANLAQLADAASRRRRMAYDSAKEAIGSRPYAESVLKLARWFETKAWREQPASAQAAALFAPIAEIAPRLIERRWRQVQKRSRRFGKRSQEERHRLRIALKKQRYVIEFLTGLFDTGAVKSFTRRLKPLQEQLGDLNDVCTAQALMHEVVSPLDASAAQLSEEAGMVLGWHRRGMADEEAKLRRNVRRLRKAKPFWRPVRPSANAETVADGEPVAASPIPG
jgi:inorganic triphosphatase YgiF